jgi:hypothetical protein
MLRVDHLGERFAAGFIASLHSTNKPARSFLGSFAVFCGLVSELANVWDGQVELAGSVVGGGSEVDEVLESPSHSLC